VSARDILELRQAIGQGGANVAGVLSGTSADGIAVVIARICASAAPPVARKRPPELAFPQVLAFETRPFPSDLAARVRSVLDGAHTGLRETALLSRDLGRAFGTAVRELARERNLDVELVGSHGQTVYHHDGVEPSGPATLQLGDGDFVAEAAQCAVVSDFRSRDIACGGEGAPISALADELLFQRAPRPSAILNLGGMANLTLLPESDPERLLSFDAGPACSLLDGLARRFLGRPFDPDGSSARAGKPSEKLLAELERHPYLALPPPKSTGRDTFGERWIDGLVERARELGVLVHDRACQDLLASAAEFVARSVASHWTRYAPSGTRALIVCGGGSRHGPVVEALARLAPFPVVSSAEYGVQPEAREALVFATLAAQCILGRPVTRPSATGAVSGRTLGKISLAPVQA
jgi:anhydro-N-acetylmuramic acid kinase